MAAWTYACRGQASRGATDSLFLLNQPGEDQYSFLMSAIVVGFFIEKGGDKPRTYVDFLDLEPNTLENY